MWDRNIWNHLTMLKLLVLDRNTWFHITMWTNDYYNQIDGDICKKWLQLNIKKNKVMIIIKYLQMNQISTLNNPQGVDMPLNKPNLKRN